MNFFVKKTMKFFVLFGMFVLVLASCSPNSGEEKILRVALEKAMTTLNYQAMTSREEMEQVAQIMEGLTRYNGDRQLVPAGADSWELSEDQLKYVFTLRNDAKWTNGAPVTANDYVFAWQTLALHTNTESAFFIDLLKNGKAVREGTMEVNTLGVKATDAYTLTVELVHPYTAFLDAVSTVTYYPLNEKAYLDIGADKYGDARETIVTNGPFTLTKYDPNRMLELTKNIAYWDAANVALNRVEVHIVPELTTQSIMFDRKELDIIRVTTDLADTYINGEDTITALEPRIVYLYLSGSTMTPNIILRDINFRKAIAYAIDKERLASAILRDGSKPLNALIPNDFGNVRGESFRDYTARHNQPIFNVEQAQEYFAAAKAALPEGTNFNITLKLQNTTVYNRVFEDVKAQIETNLPEVTLILEKVPTQVYVTQLLEKTTAAGVGSWSAPYVDYYTFADLFVKDATFNYANYYNMSYDALIAEAITRGDVEKQAKIYEAAEDVLLSDFVYIPLYQPGAKYRTQANIKGLVLNQSVPSIDYKLITID